MLVTSLYAATQKICLLAMSLFACKSRYSAPKLSARRFQPSHLITNLAYRLKPHHTRNQYLRARLDTCMDVNIMPASVYKLVFNNPELKKLASSTLENGTYTTDTLKIVGSCVFYLVHPDTKKLHEVTFLLLHKMEVFCCHVQQPCPCIDKTKNKIILFAT